MLPTVFIATTLLTLVLAYRVIRFEASRWITSSLVLLWTIAQGWIAQQGLYEENLDAMPPRFAWVLIPTLVAFVLLFSFAGSRCVLDRLDLKALTLLSIVRIPVELVLYGLYAQGAIPELMTFVGRNFDILAGITAPFVLAFAFGQQGIKKNLLLLWNAISLALLLSIIFQGVLSAPTPLQKFAFDQPNLALLRFPYIWLPAVIVPLVLFSHLISLRQLLKK